MRFSTIFFAALSLATSATAIPVAAEKRDAEVSVSFPLLKVQIQLSVPPSGNSYRSIALFR
jgi:hypothetical protein